MSHQFLHQITEAFVGWWHLNRHLVLQSSGRSHYSLCYWLYTGNRRTQKYDIYSSEGPYSTSQRQSICATDNALLVLLDKNKPGFNMVLWFT